MTTPKRPVGSHVTITTRAELDQRYASRLTLEAGMHLTPGNTQFSDVRSHLHTIHEERIKRLEQGLQSARDTIRSDLLRAKLKNRAKAGFDRSR